MKKNKLKKNIFTFFIIIFGIFFVICFLFFVAEFTGLNKKEIKEIIKKEEKPKKEEHKLSMLMVGDALYHTAVYNDGKQSDGSYNYDKQLSYLKPLVSKYDLAYYNQETILGGKEIGLSSYPTFNSPQEVGDAFIKAGFNLVSLANNHTLDKGSKGVLNSAIYWRGKQKDGVMTAGSYDSIDDRNRSHIGEKNGIKYAFLAYTTTTNGIKAPTGKEYYVNVYDEETVAADIAKVKDSVDVIFVSMHWGVEYTHTPTDEQREIAQFLADQGVDVVIGSHPHVIQPIEHIGDTVVIYSLGNLISSQREVEKRVGLISTLEINKVVEDGNTTVTIDNVTGDLVYTYYTSSLKNFKPIPFYELDNSLLSNHETIKQKYEAIINQNDSSIIVGSLSA